MAWVIRKMRVGSADLDTVLCDVGGVILLFDSAVAADIETRHGLKRGTLLPTALKTPVARRAMVGAVSAQQWRRETAEVLGGAAVMEWLDYHGDLNHEVVECLRAVRSGGVRVVLLSNATDRLAVDLAFHRLGDLADAVFCSADIRLAKPSPAAYRYAARHGGFSLERALYVDDTPSWVAAGAGLGLQGHVFESPQILVKDLKARGLLP